MPVKRIFLPGIDCFQLLVDHHATRSGGNGHEARLALYIDGSPGEDQVREFMTKSPVCRDLAQYRVSKHGGLGYPVVKRVPGDTPVPVFVFKSPTETIPNPVLNYKVDVYRQPPLALHLVYFPSGKSCLLFTFHHILFDFAGVQTFLRTWISGTPYKLFPDKIAQQAFGKRFTGFFRAVAFAFREGTWKMKVVGRKLPSHPQRQLEFTELEFSDSETARVDACAAKAGAALHPGLYQLACICRALYTTLLQDIKPDEFFWVPLPVNVRKKENRNALLFNGLTFLFYKLRPADLQSATSILEALRGQMIRQMRAELPRGFNDFADAYRYVPLFFYYPMLRLPSWGKLNTFNFSTLGETFVNLDAWLGYKIEDVKNFPSNAVTPPFTFLCYRFRGKLKLSVSWVQGHFSKEEQREVLETVKSLLMQNPGSTGPG